jgi:hypothetical protein
MLSCSEVRCVLIEHRTLREASLTQGLGDPVSRPHKIEDEDQSMHWFERSG